MLPSPIPSAPARAAPRGSAPARPRPRTPGDRRRRLALAVAEIDQRRQRVRRAACARPARPAAEAIGAGGAAAGASSGRVSGLPETMAGSAPAAPIAITAGALARSSSTTRCAIFGPIPGAARIALTSPSDSARATPSGPSVPRIASAALAPTPCTGHQQPVPLPLRQRPEADELHQVLAHHELGVERHRPARRRHRRQRPLRAVDEVADAAGVDQHVVGAAVVEPPADLADHAPRPRERRVEPAAEPGVVRVAERDRQRVGRVRPGQHDARAAAAAPCARPAPCRHGRRRPPPSSPRSARTRPPRAPPAPAPAARCPRACPSFSVPARVLVDEGLLDRRRLRPVRDQHRGQRRVQAARAAPPGRRPPIRTPRSPRGGCASPSTSTTPHPVRRSPGSIPMTRIGRPFCSVASLSSLARSQNIRQGRTSRQAFTGIRAVWSGYGTRME